MKLCTYGLFDLDHFQFAEFFFILFRPACTPHAEICQRTSLRYINIQVIR